MVLYALRFELKKISLAHVLHFSYGPKFGLSLPSALLADSSFTMTLSLLRF